MDLFDYISEDQSSSPLLVKDKTYNKLVNHLNEFLKSISEKDKQILMQTISKCYLKYQNSIIKDDENSIMEVNIRLLMSMLLEKKVEYNKDS